MGLKNDIEQRLNVGQSNSLATKIVAVSFLYSTMPDKSTLKKSGFDTYYVKRESKKSRLFRFMLEKILPGYQPHILPEDVYLSQDTLFVGRQLKPGEKLDYAHINSVHAKLLSGVMKKNSCDALFYAPGTFALAVSGNSIANGESRIAIVVKAL